MLSKLFHPRQSTTSRQVPLKSGPTWCQSTTDKAPSTPVRTLKKIKTALLPSRFNKEDIDRASERSRRTHKTSPSDERWGNIGRSPFRPQNREIRRAVPIPAHRYFEANAALTNTSDLNGALTTTQARDPEWELPVNPFPIPVALAARAVKTLAKTSSRFYEHFPSSEVEAEALEDMARITALDVHRASVEELRPRQATYVSAHVTSTTERNCTAVAAHHPTEEQRAAGIEVRAKTEKQRIGGRTKWWEMGGSLRDTKRHGPYCSTEQIADGAYTLKRGRVNKRRDQPRKYQSSKHPQELITVIENQPSFSRDAAQEAPASIFASISTFHNHGSKFIEMFEDPNQPVGTLANQRNSTRDTAARQPRSTTRHPLGSLDLNMVLSGGAQEPRQADATEDSDDGNSSLRENAEVPAPYPPLWFGQPIFTLGPKLGPTQL
ncbi:hypothetical protein FS837_010585 [Tulasnella sp. UAMH 9824]|nr:hypothetical protein FS837_010585 [Tulasnella sp. UAMH 9824]